MAVTYMIYATNNATSDKYIRQFIAHDSGKQDYAFSRSEAKRFCQALKAEGRKYHVYQQVNVTDEFI